MADKPKKESWTGIVDLLSNEIQPALNWQDATIIGGMEKMCEIFDQAFPGQMYSEDDMRLALYDMGIKHERNEHNEQYYYLAKWK